VIAPVIDTKTRYKHNNQACDILTFIDGSNEIDRSNEVTAIATAVYAAELLIQGTLLHVYLTPCLHVGEHAALPCNACHSADTHNLHVSSAQPVQTTA
jgi:hypothetical protein